MSLELIDLRAKVTAETWCALAAHARAHELDKSEVARQVLHEWAMRQIHGARMLRSCLASKGLTAAAEGISGATQGKNDGLTWADE